MNRWQVLKCISLSRTIAFDIFQEIPKALVIRSVHTETRNELEQTGTTWNELERVKTTWNELGSSGTSWGQQRTDKKKTRNSYDATVNAITFPNGIRHYQ